VREEAGSRRGLETELSEVMGDPSAVDGVMPGEMKPGDILLDLVG